MKKILITGANGGFGKLTTQTLIQQGHQVTGTMRDITGRNSEAAQELKAMGARVVAMDVTSQDSVDSAVEEAIAQMGGLDAVVNNAGVGVLGMQEHFTIEDWQRLFDVNVYGVQRVCRATIPAMRKQGSGLQVFISSCLGRIILPFYGPYNASKWAVEAMAENYRVELSGFGISCCVVEPGGYPTTFFNSLIKPSDESRNEAYGEFMNAPQGMFDSFGEALAQTPEQNPQNVADAVSKIINTPAQERPFRTVVDSMGMGQLVPKNNEVLEESMKALFSSFGLESMLTPHTKEAVNPTT